MKGITRAGYARTRAIWVGYAGAMVLSQCSDATGPSLCQRPVTLSVSASATPAFSWTPNCGVTSLRIYEEAAPGSVVWSIAGANSQPLPSPITYAHSPPGAQELVAPSGLVIGTTYRVSLFVVDAPAGGSADRVLTSATFAR